LRAFQHLHAGRCVIGDAHLVEQPPVIPDEFRRYGGHDVCNSGRGHKCNFPQSLVESFIKWIRLQGDRGTSVSLPSTR
jgi:hypothetical protein